MSDKKDQVVFAEHLVVLALALGVELEGKRMKVYGDLLLREYSVDQLEQACHFFSREAGRKFFPTVPEFHQAILGNQAAKASEALELIKRAMSKSGSYRSVSFTDQALMVTVERLGGWIGLCAEYREISAGKTSFWEHNFRQVYQQALVSGAKPQQPYSRGIAEASNASFTVRELPEAEVDVYGADGARKRLLVSAVAPEQKTLTEGKEDSVLDQVSNVVRLHTPKKST